MIVADPNKGDEQARKANKATAKQSEKDKKKKEEQAAVKAKGKRSNPKS